MLCALILYVSGGTYSLTSTPNDRFLRNFFVAGLFTLRVFDRNLLREEVDEEIFFIFHFWWLTCNTNNKPTHYILDHGDFNLHTYIKVYCKQSILKTYNKSLNLKTTHMRVHAHVRALISSSALNHHRDIFIILQLIASIHTLMNRKVRSKHCRYMYIRV